MRLKRCSLFTLFLILILTLNSLPVFAGSGTDDGSTEGEGWTPNQGNSGVVQTGDDEFDYITDTGGGDGGVIVTDEYWRYNKTRTLYVLNVSIFS